MNRYVVLSPLTIGPGAELVPSEQQLDARRHLLAPVDGSAGVFVTLAAAQFKAGETLVIDDDTLPKSAASLLAAEGQAVAAARKTRRKAGAADAES